MNTKHLRLVTPEPQPSTRSGAPPESAFQRVGRLFGEVLLRFGTPKEPTMEELRELSNEILAALVLARVRLNFREEAILMDALGVVDLVMDAVRSKSPPT